MSIRWFFEIIFMLYVHIPFSSSLACSRACPYGHFAYKTTVHTPPLLRQQNMKPFNFLALFSLFTAGVVATEAMINHISLLSPEEALQEARQQGYLMKAAVSRDPSVTLNGSNLTIKPHPDFGKLGRYYSEGRIRDIKWILDASIRENVKMLSSLFGNRNDDPELDFDPLYSLSGTQFDQLIRYLRDELMDKPNADKIIKMLGNSCSRQLEARIRDFIERVKMVIKIPKEKLDCIRGDLIGRDIVAFGNHFAKRLAICKKYSTIQLALLSAMIMDPTFSTVDFEKWFEFVGKIRYTRDKKLLGVSPSECLELLQDKRYAKVSEDCKSKHFENFQSRAEINIG